MIPKTITQTVLERYRTLVERERKTTEKRIALRNKLMALLEAGSPVQPGGLTPVVKTYESYALTRQAVIDALGDDTYDWLREQIEPAERVVLRVVESDGE